MKKGRWLKSFLKGMIATFTLIILLEGFIIYGFPAFGLNVNDTISYFTETITAAKNKFSNVQELTSNSGSTHKLQNGPMEGTGALKDTSSLDSPVNTGEEYSFDTTTYPYRAILSESGQTVYNQIYANALNYNTNGFTLVTSLSEDDLSDTMNAVFNDHPELFWLNTSYKYGYSSSGKVVQVQLSYGISSDDLSTAKSAFDSAVSTIVTNANNYSSEIEKELYIHDAIANMCTYDSSASLNQSAYSALVQGKSVCAGYSRAFQTVCQNAGLTCYYLTGTASGGDHAWNIISVDGDFYNVDLTWDDSISESYGSSVYTYFNLTDSDISVDHSRSTLSAKLPSCTATAMSYTNVYGSTVEIDDITNNGDGQITDGNFTIKEPKEPIADWHDGAPGEIPQNDIPQNDIPQNNGPMNNPRQNQPPR